MEQNEEILRAWDFVEHTHTSIFLTGKAGTGKTTFLRSLREKSAKSIVVVAPTGVAAINAGGVTIHSFFQLPLTPYVPGMEVRDKFNFSKEKLRVIRMLDLLVIDEISMVRADLLDAIDNALRKYRRDSRPFGGVQLLMIGDLQQLSPVLTPADEEFLGRYYPSPYFFGSRALQQIDYVTIELSKVYRQQNRSFIDLLNNVRTGHLTHHDIDLLNSRYQPGFVPPTGTDFIRLTTHNATADRYNEERLARLRATTVTYNATVKGTFPESSYPTASSLTLKIGAQVMFVRNDPSPEHQYYNGKIGQVVDADDEMVKVLCAGESEPIEVKPIVWENARYSVDDESGELVSEVQGTFSQMPLRLAWSITVHKSQGLTFERAVIDAGASFAPGQVYVALSRCKSLEGIVLATPITSDVVMVDTRVTDYVSHQADEALRSIARLPAIKEEYYRMLAIELFTFASVCQCEERLARFLGEHCRRTYPHIVEQHQEVTTQLRSQVIEVADKWLSLLRYMPSEQLHSEAVMERIKRSSQYFHDTLLTLLEPVFEKITSVVLTAKAAALKFKELVTDLFQTAKSAIMLLEAIAERGFSIATYLDCKQRAMAEATRDPSVRPRKKQKDKARLSKSSTSSQSDKSSRKTSRDQESKRASGASSQAAKSSSTHAASPADESSDSSDKSKKKSPVNATWMKTYRMFADGLSPESIAERRQLAVSTVWSHLSICISRKMIDIHDLLDDDIIDSVTAAVADSDLPPMLTAIHQALNGRVGYNEIRAVLCHLHPATD